MTNGKLAAVLFLIFLFSGCSGSKGASSEDGALVQQEAAPNRPPAAPDGQPAAAQNAVRGQVVCVSAACGSFRLEIGSDMTGSVADLASGAGARRPAAVSVSGDHLYMDVGPAEGANPERLRTMRVSGVLDGGGNITLVGIITGGSVYNPATVVPCP